MVDGPGGGKTTLVIAWAHSARSAAPSNTPAKIRRTDIGYERALGEQRRVAPAWIMAAEGRGEHVRSRL